MDKNIEFSELKKAITNDEKSEEYNTWLHQDEKNPEMVERMRSYYSSGVDDTITEAEVEKCWSELKRKKFGKHRLAVKLTVTVAAAIAILFLSITIFDEETSLPPMNTVAVEKQKEIKEALLSSTNIILTTESGKQYVINAEKELNLIADTMIAEEQRTIYVPKGKNFKLTLSDGTIVHLNNHTTFTYPTRFISSDLRKVTLKGEAYFEVTSDTDRRFIVEAEGVEVKVYGTKFNVNTFEKGVVKTVLTEGSVAVNENRLTPNHKLTYNTSTNRVVIEKVDVNNYTSWVSGIYRFNRQPLQEIISSLALWYDLEVVYEDENVKNLEYICNIPRYNTIDEVLEILEKCGNIGYRKDGRKLFIWFVQ